MSKKVQVYDAPKHPLSELDYGRNWAEGADGTPGWLNTGEVIVESTWTITCDREAVPTLIESDEGTGISNGVTSIYLKGGTDGYRYELTNHIVTDQGGVTRKESKIGIINCCSTG